MAPQDVGTMNDQSR